MKMIAIKMPTVPTVNKNECSNNESCPSGCCLPDAENIYKCQPGTVCREIQQKKDEEYAHNQAKRQLGFLLGAGVFFGAGALIAGSIAKHGFGTKPGLVTYGLGGAAGVGAGLLWVISNIGQY